MMTRLFYWFNGTVTIHRLCASARGACAVVLASLALSLCGCASTQGQGGSTDLENGGYNTETGYPLVGAGGSRI